MSSAFRISIAYLLCALALTILISQDLVGTLVLVTATATNCSRLMAGGLVWFLLLIPIAAFWIGPRAVVRRIGDISLMVALSIFLQIGYLLAKSAVPEMIPFYADPYLAKIDRALLLGNDAWQVAHAIAGESGIRLFSALYMPVWSAAALGFPILLAATDPDPARAGRYVWLFVLAWFVLGNVLATLGSSVGLVYYDRLLGTDRFADLKATLDQSGFAASALGQLQDRLWAASSDPGVPISFVSAFPSVHVGIATVAALYLSERAPRFAVFGYAFLAMIAFISVYSGYHYAIGSFTGFAVVVAMSAALRRLMAVTPHIPALSAMPASALPAGQTRPQA